MAARWARLYHSAFHPSDAGSIPQPGARYLRRAQPYSGVTLDDLQAFISEVSAYLQARGGKVLQVLLPPLQHDPADVSVQYFLFRAQGFGESLVDLNYAQCVDHQPFVEKINYAKRQRLNKCRREGFEVSAVAAERLPDVYATIAENRASRGYPMTMGEESLRQMQELFPDAVQLYACEHQGQMAAAAICLRLSPDVLYVLYWGDRPGYRRYSPVVLIADCLYQSCQTRGIGLLDVGTSTQDLQPNFGLIRFKRALGFSESLKFRWRSALNRDIESYSRSYRVLPFEATQLEYRRRVVLQQVAEFRPASLLEVGCGLRPLFTDLDPARGRSG